MWSFRKLRGRFLVIALCCGLISTATAGFAQSVSRLAKFKNVTWVSLLNVQRKAPVKVISNLSESKAILKLEVLGYEKGSLFQENLEFTGFDFPDAGLTSIVGQPELPVIRRFVVIPDGATVSSKVTLGRSVTVNNVQVHPVQEPLPEQTDHRNGSLPQRFIYNKSFYALNQLYPASLVTVSKPMKMRNTTVVMVEMAAMQCNPGQKVATVYPELSVELSFSKPFTTTISSESGGSGILSNLSSNLIFKKDWIKDLLAHLKWHYLIITPDNYYDEIQPFATWKRSKGLIVNVTKLSSISAAPTPAQIRAYIKKAYEDHAVEYVLLVGDTDTMPPDHYSIPIDGTIKETVTDYSYALVSGAADDPMPDLAIGRFSGRSKAEISHIVSKSVSYEKTPLAGDWKKKALCISDVGYFEVTSNDNCARLQAHGFTVDKIYRSLGNDTKAAITAAINDGRLLVSYRGHGGQTGWDTTGFSNTDVNALANGRKMPVIISPTCLTGMYDYPASDSFAEAWVKAYRSPAPPMIRPFPRGAVAYWGSARVSYGGYNDALSIGAFKDMLDNGDHVIGKVVNNAKIYMLSNYGLTDMAQLELRLFNLFGDPGLNISF